MAQLYAICRPGGVLEVRHVQLVQQLQAELDGIFLAQEGRFFEGIGGEVAFTGDWKPDPDELLVISGLPEAQAVVAAADQNAIALPVLDAANFIDQGVRGLFTVLGIGANRKILIQYFNPQQILSGRFALLHDGNVFRRITEPAFSLGSELVATLSPNGDLRFKSFAMIRRIFDVTPVFREATDAELVALCAHPSLAVANVAAFVAMADEVLRKHVLAVTKAHVLNAVAVADIQARAAQIGFPVIVQGGQLVVPENRREAKAFFSFLLNKVYLGPIAQQLFITNSNRPLQ